MNLDPRSATPNTEIGVAVHSPALARRVLSVFRIDGTAGLDEVRLARNGSTAQWVARDPQGLEQLHHEPELGIFGRWLLWFQSLFVAEDLL